jgi:hypothetical protein
LQKQMAEFYFIWPRIVNDEDGLWLGAGGLRRDCAAPALPIDLQGGIFGFGFLAVLEEQDAIEPFGSEIVFGEAVEPGFLFFGAEGFHCASRVAPMRTKFNKQSQFGWAPASPGDATAAETTGVSSYASFLTSR